MALLMAAVSLVDPLPVAPKFKTLMIEPLLFTVSVAGLLVTLPTVLLTTTVNCAPLSEFVVAGVV